MRVSDCCGAKWFFWRYGREVVTRCRECNHVCELVKEEDWNMDEDTPDSILGNKRCEKNK